MRKPVGINSAILAQWTDEQVLDAYQASTGEPGEPEVEALIAEIQRRGLDV